MKYLILLTLMSCSYNTDGLRILREREAEYCLNGWKYMDAGQGQALYLDVDGNPESCSMEEK